MQQGSPTYDSKRLRVAERRAIGKVFRRQSAFFFAHGGETSRESAPVGQVVKRSVVHYSAENPSSPGQKLGGALLAESGGPPRRAPGRRKRLPLHHNQTSDGFSAESPRSAILACARTKGFCSCSLFLCFGRDFPALRRIGQPSCG